MRGAVAAAALLLTAALAPSAHAVEREHHIGAGFGPSVFDGGGDTTFGLALDAHYVYGLSDAFNLLAEGSWSIASFHPDGGPPGVRPSFVADADVGAAYVLDVLQWVPYAGVLAGGGVLSGGALGRTKVLPDLELAAGLDYRIDRSWLVGVAVRQHMLYTELSTYPTFTQVFARFEYAWGW